MIAPPPRRPVAVARIDGPAIAARMDGVGFCGEEHGDAGVPCGGQLEGGVDWSRGGWKNQLKGGEKYSHPSSPVHHG